MRADAVCVLGGGLWGRALASAAARAGSAVTLITSRSLPALEGVACTPEVGVAADHTLIVVAVPSAHVRDAATRLAPHLSGAHFLVHGVRGLVGDAQATVSDVLAEETPVKRLGALGGPVLAAELAEGEPSVMVVGSRFREVVDLVRERLGTETLRLYATRDLRGLEWASALTGCYAIAIGYALGAAAGPGLVAAFTTRVAHEAARVAYAAGGETATALGLGGLGDLLAASGQSTRPEILVGRALAAGASIADAARATGERVEAIPLLPRVAAWSARARVRAPILTALVGALSGEAPKEALIRALMSAPIVELSREEEARSGARAA
ncbi:MAG: NAD(P)-binding domain-containing protein [Polyangiaceae bacterium]|nr:NAD(P)-binding domain-containing protein [Polyangiaceae bacterium]